MVAVPFRMSFSMAHDEQELQSHAVLRCCASHIKPFFFTPPLSIQSLDSTIDVSYSTTMVNTDCQNHV
jgi:hypothetical protein